MAQINFWKDDTKRCVDPELFSSKAEQLAKQIHQNSKKDFKGKLKENTYTQIRKFYDEVIMFGSKLKEISEDKQLEEFTQILPYLKMLNAKVAYAHARELVTDDFKTFINDSLKQVKELDDFWVFSGFFEAFMGYYKYFEKLPQAESQGGRR